MNVARGLKVAIIGAGWPGAAHARGYQSAGGYELYAVADLIPQRRDELGEQFAISRRYASADEALRDPGVEVVSICLPNHLHAQYAAAALKAGKHVVCETPPATSVGEVKRMAAAATKAGKVLLFSLQRRFGGCEQAARQAVARGLMGQVYHVRAAWMRTRAVPSGTGWYGKQEYAGGGAMADLGLQMLDLAWDLLGNPQPLDVYAANHRALNRASDFEVEEAGFALIRFEGDRSLELSASWAMNQPPQQNGAVCRACGTQGALEVYTPHGATLYRDFDPAGKCRAISLKGPTMLHHAALMRHLRACISGKAQPQSGVDRAMVLMEMLQAIYKSARTHRSVSLTRGAAEKKCANEPAA